MTLQSLSSEPDHEKIPYDQLKLAEYVRRWGNSASTSLFNSNCCIYSTSGIEGIIGYRIESNYAIVFGDPLCAQSDIPQLTQKFHQFCKEKKWRIVYLTASEGFVKWAIHRVCGAFMEVGEELILDPKRNPKSGAKRRGLRNKVNLAQRSGVEVNEYVGQDTKLEKELEQVGISWLEGRKGPQIYLTQVKVFEQREGKRWFYAKCGEMIVGLLILQRLEVRQGWLVQFLMSVPEAPKGTSEQLVIVALNRLRNEGCRFLSFGVAQVENLGEIEGLNVVSEWIVRTVFKVAKRMFGLDRRRRFWRKFQPQKEPSYLLFSERGIDLKGVRSVMRALNVSI